MSQTQESGRRRRLKSEALDKAQQFLRLADHLRKHPEEARDQLARALGMVRAARLFRGCKLGFHVCVLGPMRVLRQGEIVLGDRVTFFGGMLESELLCHRGGVIHIGEGSGFNYGVSLEAAEEIRIGKGCMLASFVRISDREEGTPKKVVIGDGVWIAHGAIIKPGVTIGDRSVVSAGSVVERDVPPDSLAVGNPARSMPLQMVPQPKA